MRQVAPMCTPYIESQKWLPWQRPSAPLDAYVTHDSLGPSEPQPKRHLDRFSRFCTDYRRVSLCVTMGANFPQKLLLSMGGSGPPSNTWFSGPTRVLNPNDISIGSAILQGSLISSVTDRQTDRQTTLLGR